MWGVEVKIEKTDTTSLYPLQTGVTRLKISLVFCIIGNFGNIGVNIWCQYWCFSDLLHSG